MLDINLLGKGASTSGVGAFLMSIFKKERERL